MPARRPPKPSCPDCNGRGGSLRAGRWTPCGCTRATSHDVELSRRINEVGGRRRKTLDELIRESEQEGKDWSPWPTT